MAVDYRMYYQVVRYYNILREYKNFTKTSIHWSLHLLVVISMRFARD